MTGAGAGSSKAKSSKRAKRRSRFDRTFAISSSSAEGAHNDLTALLARIAMRCSFRNHRQICYGGYRIEPASPNDASPGHGTGRRTLSVEDVPAAADLPARVESAPVRFGRRSRQEERNSCKGCSLSGLSRISRTRSASHRFDLDALYKAVPFDTRADIASKTPRGSLQQSRCATSDESCPRAGPAGTCMYAFVHFRRSQMLHSIEWRLQATLSDG